MYHELRGLYQTNGTGEEYGKRNKLLMPLVYDVPKDTSSVCASKKALNNASSVVVGLALMSTLIVDSKTYHKQHIGILL